MRDIVFISSAGYGLREIRDALPEGITSIFDEENDRLVVRIGRSENVVEFVRDDSVGEYYDEPQEIAALAYVGAAPQFFVVHFKEIEQLKLVLFAVADRRDVVIDNDFGIVESGDKFVLRCKDSPNWDWANT
jgi:hypothetical protein